jgi:long-chain fatty acid transport protein
MRTVIKGGAAIILWAAGSGAWAAGFAVSDKSVSSLGSAFAGMAAQAQDASVVYTNPAAMQHLSGSTLSLGAHSITPQATYTDRGSNTGGTDPGDAGRSKLAPNLYYVTELSPGTRFGIGVYAPFALGLEYDTQWPGRYRSIESHLTTLNIAPALSWQLTPVLSLGGSLDFQYLTAKLSQAVDFGAIINPALAGTMDGSQTLSGDSWDTGYSLGLHYAPTERLNLGATYHSDTRQNIDGTSDFEGVPAPLAGMFTDSAGSTRVHLPESLSLSAAWAAGERLTLLADYTWTAWSRHRDLVVHFANGLPDSTSVYNWHDVGFYSLGASYRLSPSWLLRAGVAYDESPVPDAAHRSPLGPDNDRRWYALGLNYVAGASFSIDAALAYVDVADAAIDSTDALGHTLTGEYSLNGRFVSVQANWRY